MEELPVLARGIPAADIEDATRWVAEITGMASGFFVSAPEMPTGLGGGPPQIYGNHPAVARLARVNPMAVRRRDHALWHAAMKAIQACTPVAVDSPLGRQTIWACPITVEFAGATVLRGAMAAFIHTPRMLASADELAQTFGVSPDDAFAALEECVKNPLDDQKVEAAKMAMVTLCRAFETRVAGQVEALAAQQRVDEAVLGAGAVSAAPEDPLDSLAALMLDHGSLPELSVSVVRLLASSFGIPSVAMFLTQPADRCRECWYAVTCRGAPNCLHKVAAVGRGNDVGHDRIPLALVPASLQPGRGFVVLRKRPLPEDGPLGKWLAEAGGKGAFLRTDTGPELQSLLALGSPRALPSLFAKHVEPIRRHISLVMAGARILEEEKQSVQRLQELGLRLAASNERLRAAQQARNALLASMSHELRTPLNAIIGLAELIRDGAVGEVNQKQSAYLTTIESSGRHLVRLLDDLLDIATIETGHFRLRPEPCSVARVLTEASQMVQPLACRRQVELALSLPADSCIFITDPERLRQIAANLLSNAVKFSPPGEQVRLSAELQAGQLWLRVRDRGPGVPPAEREAIFEDFHRGVHAGSTDEVGCGLGLPLVKRLVEVQGGRVEVESVPGKGSEFRVILPALSSAQEQAEYEPLTVPVVKVEDGRTVLVVERDAPSRIVLCQAVADAGFQPVEVPVPGGLTAVLQDVNPVAVVFGQARGGHALDEALHGLRTDPTTRDVPIIFLGDLALCQQALEIGVSESLTYPVTRDRLSAVLKRIAGRQEGVMPCLVLILDDNASFSHAMAVVLQEAGLGTVQARDGVEGLEMVRRHHPDVILLDLMLPRLSGWQVLEALRQDPGTRGIPVVVMSVKSLTPDERRELEAIPNVAILPKTEFSCKALLGLFGRLGVRLPEGNVA